MKRLIGVVVLVLSLVTMTGCKWFVKASYQRGGTKIEGGIEGEVKANSTYSAMSTQFDASEFVLDFSGTTFDLPASGMATVGLGSAGAASPRVTTRVAWVRSGEFIFLSNPAAVNQWVSQNGQSDDSLTYSLDQLPDTTESGQQETVAVTSIYNNQITASSSQTFTGGGRGGCTEVRCHQQ
ncbi:MAG: hypothetical protein NDI66_00515 [Pseudomonas sp.]|nr:hypothetical protein [Pseudomonas sp.]